jgi:hypothetical protein
MFQKTLNKTIKEEKSMGLKTTNYKVKGFDITLPEAYARLANVSIDLNGKALGVFAIHQNREDIVKSQPLERIHISSIIDKELPVHSQLYIKAKKEVFADWEDDIVEEIEGEVE